MFDAVYDYIRDIPLGFCAVDESERDLVMGAMKLPEELTPFIEEWFKNPRVLYGRPIDLGPPPVGQHWEAMKHNGCISGWHTVPDEPIVVGCFNRPIMRQVRTALIGEKANGPFIFTDVTYHFERKPCDVELY